MMTLSIMMNFIFMLSKHPLSMGITLIMQTMLVAMITGSKIWSFWYSYILIITMLSGMLVLFIYMASIASNEKFKLSITMVILSSMIIITGISWDFAKNKINLYSESMIMKSTTIYDQAPSLAKLFSTNMMITIMIINYLLITMISVSYIVSLTEGPLRMKN